MAEQVEAVIPPQHKGQPIYDFRNAAHGPRGYKCVNKRKLDEYEDQVWLHSLCPDTRISSPIYDCLFVL